MKLHNYLKEHILITDGAMGTYYDLLYPGSSKMAETANLNYPERILKIHKEYIKKGARLLRTNTFALHETAIGPLLPEGKALKSYIKENLKAAVSLARQAAKESGEQVYVAGDIGPIPFGDEEQVEEEEYYFLVDAFLEEGIDVFVLETFSDTGIIKKIGRYIREKAEDAFILAQFSINPTGYSQMGKSVEHIFRAAGEMEELDACGLNCNIGAAHMLKFLNRMEFPVDKYVSALPNCGYPHIVRGKMIYSDNAVYFGEQIARMATLGVNIIGGCCGTTPEYIGEIAKHLESGKPGPRRIFSDKIAEKSNQISPYPLMEKLKEGKKVIAVELDPPFNEDTTKFMESAFFLKEKGVDMITIADSPMARSRADSLLVASKLKKDVGITVLPHFTCRDRNRIGVRSSVLGAYMNEIRNMLIVTGDPVGTGDRDNTKGVFDFNSIRMMEFIKDMNQEHFAREPICLGGALNQNSASLDALIRRTEKKINAGASFFLTQPMYDQESIERIRQIKETLHTKIFCGIMPLVSYRNAMFIKNEMPGIFVPDEIVNRYGPDMTKEEAENVAVEISLDLIGKMGEVTDGYYFMTPFNRARLIGRIIDEMKKMEG